MGRCPLVRVDVKCCCISRHHILVELIAELRISPWMDTISYLCGCPADIVPEDLKCTHLPTFFWRILVANHPYGYVIPTSRNAFCPAFKLAVQRGVELRIRLCFSDDEI